MAWIQTPNILLQGQGSNPLRHHRGLSGSGEANRLAEVIQIFYLPFAQT